MTPTPLTLCQTGPFYDGSNKVTDALGSMWNGRNPQQVPEIAQHVRQHLINLMLALSQSGIDHALDAALESYDRKLEQEGIA